MKEVLRTSNGATVVDVPAPAIEKGQVLVEVAYSMISSGTEAAVPAPDATGDHGRSLLRRATDQPENVVKVLRHLRRHGIEKTVARIQSRVIGEAEGGSPSGYSCSGVVVQVGENVMDIRPGYMVACAGGGRANHAEIVLVPRNLVVKIPEGCGLRDAASVTLGSIAMQGVRRADPRLGEIIGVIGLGLVGQLTVQLLKVAGCRVLGLDLDPRRVELARRLRADWAFSSTDVDALNEVRQVTGGHGVDATIITAASASDSVVQQAMEMTRKKGRVVVVGAVGLGLERSPFYEKEIDFLISSSYGPGRYDDRYEEQGVDYPYSYVRWTENRNMAEYLRLVADGKVDVDAIIEREYEVTEAAQAYEALQTPVERPIGVVLRYPVDAESRTSKRETRVRLRSSASTGRINVALIGAGNFAKGMLLPNLQALSDTYHIRAIVSGTGSNARLTGQQFGADYCTTRYADVLEDKDVHMIVIATRHHLHAEQAAAAAQAGKAVFLEKPMAMNQAELDHLSGVIEQSGVPFMVGFNRRFSPAARLVKGIVTQRQNPLMVLYRVNAGYLPPDHWVHGPEGGGRIVGEACHMLDLFNFLVDSDVDSVSAESIAPSDEHMSGADNVSATVRYADGSVCTLFYTALGHGSVGKEYVEVYADGKVLIIDDFKELRAHGVASRRWAGAEADKGHRQALEFFAKNVQKGLTWPIPLDQLISATRASFSISGHSPA